MKNSNYNIGNQTRDLPACSASTRGTPPGTPHIHTYIYIYIYIYRIKLIWSLFILLVHEQSKSLNTIHINIKLLHVSTPGCHPQGDLEQRNITSTP